MITPRVLKGFRDTLPKIMITKKTIIDKFEDIFEKFGFVPIDTPALEYTEILLGKGGGDTDKQIYRFNDHGDRDISLRFDLTVPLARYISQNYEELVFPFKAYHVGPVWRGENTQKGRYREFFQCDFDILGIDSTEADIEILLIIKSGLESLNAGNFRININNRKILNALLEKMKLSDRSIDILRIIDKIYKVGFEKVSDELINSAGMGESEAAELLSLLNINSMSERYEILGDEIFKYLNKMKIALGDEYKDSVNDLEYIFNSLNNLRLMDYFAFNPAITRGLDYYTGMVFESFILDRINFGSICSGGRYDNLTGLYSKNIVCGVGASFGLDRIISLLEDKDLMPDNASRTDLLILNLEKDSFTEYRILADQLRNREIYTEIFLDKKKIQNQFKFAEKKSIRYILFAGKEELEKKRFNLKDLKTGTEEKEMSVEEIVKIISQNK